jgi:hypothetical protein
MQNPGILVIETSLEGYLVEELNRRTQIDTFRGLQRTIDQKIEIFYERVHDIQGLRQIFSNCQEQNSRKRITKKKGVTITEPTNIQFIHISSHGTKDSLDLPLIAKREKKANSTDLTNAFSQLKGAGVKAIVFSCCQTGQNAALARKILEKTGIQAIVAYPDITYDHVCAIAEQLLYFQLLRNKRTRVWEAVIRVNDSLFVLGEDKKRMLACWTQEEGRVSGPYPWWNNDVEIGESKFRSYLTRVKDLIPKRGRMSEKTISELRDIMKYVGKHK